MLFIRQLVPLTSMNHGMIIPMSVISLSLRERIRMRYVPLFARCFNVEDAPDYKEAEVKLTNLADIYYEPVTSQMKFIKSGKKENMNRMLMVAFLVALIAMINYINYLGGPYTLPD